MLLPIIPKYPLHDRGIQRLIKEEKLKITPFPAEEQFQPATLDVRVGDVAVYDDEVRRAAASALNEQHEHILRTAGNDMRKAYAAIVDLEPECSPKRYAAGNDALIPSGALAEITLEERIFLDDRYYVEPELRSSRGRAHFEIQRFEYLGDGAYRLSVTNPNPNAIIVPGSSKFAQLFVNAKEPSTPHDGKILSDPYAITKALPDLADKQLVTSEGHLIFRLGKQALRFNTFGAALHLDTLPAKDELYTTIDLTKGYVQQPGEALVVQLEPGIKLPAHIGVLLMKRMPFAQPQGRTNPFYDRQMTDRTQIKAGWIDPGFPALDKAATTVTAHPYRAGLPSLLKTGQPFAVGLVYQYNTPVNHPYGSERLNSHYSGTKGLSGSQS